MKEGQPYSTRAQYLISDMRSALLKLELEHSAKRDIYHAREKQRFDRLVKELEIKKL